MRITEYPADDASAERLAHRIIAFIGGTGSFDELALDVFAYQFRHNQPYRNFCTGRGATPDRVRSWRDIPPAPAAAFKQFDLTAAPKQWCEPERGGRVFFSSGTTQSDTSRHYMDRVALDVYRAALRDGYNRFVLPDGATPPILALMPPPVCTGYSLEFLSRTSPESNSQLVGDGAPHSSLSFMLGELITDFGGAFFSLKGWQTRLARQLRELNEPVVVFGTAFAFMHFFDATPETFILPEGSRIVETGGFKGRSREVTREELYVLFTERFGVPSSHCVSEYGMSEMASQFYDSTLFDHEHALPRPMRKIAPPTIRTRIIDPVTGEDALPGQPGLLAHYDLCNLNSVMALQTEDMGQRLMLPASEGTEDGDGFVLLGRAPGAILRGCSLSAEEWNTLHQGNV
jgi:hypothetical protein